MYSNHIRNCIKAPCQTCTGLLSYVSSNVGSMWWFNKCTCCQTDLARLRPPDLSNHKAWKPLADPPANSLPRGCQRQNSIRPLVGVLIEVTVQLALLDGPRKSSQFKAGRHRQPRATAPRVCNRNRLRHATHTYTCNSKPKGTTVYSAIS